MILILIVMVAISVVTQNAVFAWIAIGIAVLMLLSSGSPKQTGYFSPFSGGSIHVEPIWYHCDEHGDVAIPHVGRPTICPTCSKELKKGKIKSKEKI